MNLNGNSTQTRRTAVQAVLVYAIPIVLIAVAGIQQVSVKAAHLSPWKGGGFGMFSTVDDPNARQLHVHALRQGQATPVMLDDVEELRPEITGVLTRARYVPTHRNLEAVARELLTVQWILRAEEGAVVLRPAPPKAAEGGELANFAETLRLETLARRMQSRPYTVFLQPLMVVEGEL